MSSGRKSSLGTALIKRKKKDKQTKSKSDSVPSVVLPQLHQSKTPVLVKEVEEELIESVAPIPSSSTSSNSFNWCLYNNSIEQQETQNYPGTPTDFILKHLLAEFKTLTNSKIQEILQLNLVHIFT